MDRIIFLILYIYITLIFSRAKQLDRSINENKKCVNNDYYDY